MYNVLLRTDLLKEVEIHSAEYKAKVRTLPHNGFAICTLIPLKVLHKHLTSTMYLHVHMYVHVHVHSSLLSLEIQNTMYVQFFSFKATIFVGGQFDMENNFEDPLLLAVHGVHIHVF